MPHRPRFKRVAASKRAPLSARLMGAAALAATLGIAVIATGCGSSKKSASAPTITKAQLLAQGNAICAEGNQKLAALQKALEKSIGSKAPSESQIKSFVTAGYVPVIQGQIDKIKALGAPSGEAAKLTSMLTLAQATLNKVKADPRTLLAGRPFAGFARAAHAYGLTSCARNA
jgi:ABC-type phosphate/phosphonate transport system substrate-binding protein